jgi:hypothetical protein
VKDGVFIEVKRLARVDLTDKSVRAGVPSSPLVKVERKPAVSKEKKADESAAQDSNATPVGPIVYSNVTVTKHLFSSINTGTAEKDVKDATIASGTLSLQSQQFTKLDINTTQSLTLLAQGNYPVDELFEPPGKKLVQIQGSPPAEGGDPWGWTQLANFTLLDAANKTYTPVGAWAKVKKEQSDRMIAKYDANATRPPDVSGSSADGRPTDVWIGFLVPSGTHLKQLQYKGKTLAEMEQVVP